MRLTTRFSLIVLIRVTDSTGFLHSGSQLIFKLITVWVVTIRTSDPVPFSRFELFSSSII
jgi:hypothetical protein